MICHLVVSTNGLVIFLFVNDVHLRKSINSHKNVFIKNISQLTSSLPTIHNRLIISYFFFIRHKCLRNRLLI